jgi:hypothetical protein
MNMKKGEAFPTLLFVKIVPERDGTQYLDAQPRYASHAEVGNSVKIAVYKYMRTETIITHPQLQKDTE